MARPKKGITFRQFLQKKDYNIFRNFPTNKMFSMHDAIKWVDEWEHERKTELKMVINNMEKEE